jgi:hypothetical protein
VTCKRTAATVGVSDHAGWAVLVTATADGTLIDRRRVELVAAELPSMPHHHDAQALPVQRAVALVERVRASADHHAARALDALAAGVSIDLTGIALRRCPALPPTVAEGIASYRAQNAADWVMYRRALAGAAEAKGWSVTWYDARSVLAEAAAVLRSDAEPARHVPASQGRCRPRSCASTIGHGVCVGEAASDAS